MKLFKARDEEQKRQEEIMKKYFSYSTLQQRAKFKPMLKKYAKKRRPPMSSEIWIRIRQNDRKRVDMNSVLEDFQKETDSWSRNREKVPMIERQRTEETLKKLAEAYEMKMIRENKKKWKREAQEERKKRKVDPLSEFATVYTLRASGMVLLTKNLPFQCPLRKRAWIIQR